MLRTAFSNFNFATLTPATAPSLTNILPTPAKAAPASIHHGFMPYGWLEARSDCADGICEVEDNAVRDDVIAVATPKRTGDATGVFAETVSGADDDGVIDVQDAPPSLQDYFAAMREKEKVVFGDVFVDTHADVLPGQSAQQVKKLPWTKMLPAQKSPERPKFMVYRADGMEPQKDPEWTSAMDLKKAREDVRALVTIVEETTKYWDTLWDKSKISRFLTPQWHFNDTPVDMIVGVDPNKKDGKGYLQASAGTEDDGTMQIMAGGDNDPDSPWAKITRPVWKDPKIFWHELGHCFEQYINMKHGLQSNYSGHTGAFSEWIADSLANGASQFLGKLGRRLTADNDGRDFEMGNIAIIDAFLRHCLFPGKFPNKSRIYSDTQKPKLGDYKQQDPATSRILANDREGVHELNSPGNVGFSKTVLDIPELDNGERGMLIVLGAINLTAAARAAVPNDGVLRTTYFDQAQMMIASAYMEYGLEMAEIVQRHFTENETLPVNMPKTEVLIKKMGIDKLKEKMDAALAAKPVDPATGEPANGDQPKPDKKRKRG